MLRIGIVGIGNMGKNHARVLSQLSSEGYPVRLDAIMDIDKEKVSYYSNKYGCYGTTQIDQMLKRGLDGVIISTPTHLHLKTSIPFIENGIDLLIEKPLAHNSNSAFEIVSKSRRYGVKILVGHIERFNPAVKKLKQIISSGDVGEVLTLSARRVGPGGLYRERFVKKVGVTLDLAIHDIDVFQYVVDRRISSLRIFSGSLVKPYEYEDYSFTLVDFNKLIGMAEANWLSPYKLRKLYLTGTEGVIEIDYITQDMKFYKEMGSQPVNIEFMKIEPLYNELIHFINILLDREEPQIDVYTAYKLIDMIEKGKVLHVSNEDTI